MVPVCCCQKGRARVQHIQLRVWRDTAARFGTGALSKHYFLTKLLRVKQLDDTGDGTGAGGMQ